MFLRLDARLNVAAMIAVMFMGSTVLTPLYAIYATSFGFSRIILTLVFASYAIGNLAALLLFGRVSDQIGRRRTVLAAMAIGGVSTLIFLLAQSTPWLFGGRALSGFAVGVATGAGTAWLTEIEPNGRNSQAALVATTANFLGLGMGPLLAGILAQYAPAPLRLSYIVYLLLLAIAAAMIIRTDEPEIKRSGHLALRPRIGIPKEVRDRFVAPAITGFSVFGFTGFYLALAPSLLGDRLHQTNHAVGGALVFELVFIAALANVAAHLLSGRAAMLSGLAVQLPALVLFVAADWIVSISWFLIASAVGGIAMALCYRGSLTVVNEIAPGDRKAETVSSYLAVCFLGNSLPVIGVALLAWATGSMVTAVMIFAATLALLAVLALAFDIRRARPQ